MSKGGGSTFIRFSKNLSSRDMIKMLYVVLLAIYYVIYNKSASSTMGKKFTLILNRSSIMHSTLLPSPWEFGTCIESCCSISVTSPSLYY